MNIFSIHCNERFRFPIVIKRCKRSLFEARDSCNVSWQEFLILPAYYLNITLTEKDVLEDKAELSRCNFIKLHGTM